MYTIFCQLIFFLIWPEVVCFTLKLQNTVQIFCIFCLQILIEVKVSKKMH